MPAFFVRQAPLAAVFNCNKVYNLQLFSSDLTMRFPHNAGKLSDHLRRLFFNFLVATVVALMLVQHFIQLGFIYADLFEENNGELSWVYTFPAVVLLLFLFLHHQKITGLLAFARDFFNALLVVPSALFLGLIERRVTINHTTLFGVVRALSALICSLSVWVAYQMWPHERGLFENLGQSVALTAALMALILYFPIAIGTASDLRALAKRPQLKKFEFNSASGRAMNVIHLSDLHITSSGDAPLTEDARRTLSDGSLSWLRTKIFELPGHPIIISGDATDTGDEREWARFLRFFGRFSKRIVLAPGNHDLNIVGYGETSLWRISDLPYYQGRIARMRSFLRTAEKVMGPRAKVLVDAKAPYLVPLKRALGGIEEERGSGQFDELSSLFPMAVKVPHPSENVFAIVWNTTRASALPALNSMGKLDANQLARWKKIEKLLRQEDRNVNVFHVVHHKIGMPDELIEHPTDLSPIKRSLQLASMVMENASSLIEVISSANKHTVVFHGHHHTRFISEVDNDGPRITVISAPSSTLGCEGHIDQFHCKQAPGFDITTVCIENGSVWVGSAPAWTSGARH